MTSTRSAAAAGLPKSFPERQSALFDLRYAAWLKSRAALAALEETACSNEKELGELEDAHGELSDEIDDMMRCLMTTYAANGANFWKKFAIFEELLIDPDVADWTDKRHLWILGCLKADVAKFVERAEEART